MVIYGHWVFKLPYFNRFIAMTFLPNIYVNDDMTKKLPDRVLRHEEVHLRQQSEAGKYWFLAKYFGEWIVNVFKYGFGMKAYYAISYEREAYVLTSPGLLTGIGYPELDSNPFHIVIRRRG
jgi:hypothetical protein